MQIRIQLEDDEENKNDINYISKYHTTNHETLLF